MQEIEMDNEGIYRFKQNQILVDLLSSGLLDLNIIAATPYSNVDKMQLAQLLGYSVSGFGDLSFADTDIVETADLVVKLLRENPRCRVLAHGAEHIIVVAKK
jgi:hypothetical protein